MKYGDVLAETWNQHVLFSVMLELTFRCNLDCFYCYNDVDAEARPMGMGDYLDLLSDLEQLGTMNISLTGGEPLASPHFFPLGNAARERGFVVRVKSNAHALRYDLALRLKQQVDPFLVEVSIHGATAPIHDRQTRVAGSFDQLMKNLAAMRDVGLRVQLNSTLTSWNEHELDQMFELARTLGLRLQMDSRVTPRDNGDLEPLKLTPSRDGVERLMKLQKLRWLQERSGQPQKNAPQPEIGVETVKHHCGAGAASVTVDPRGNVYPCVQWRKPIGNLHEQSIGEIWKNSPRLREAREITHQVKTMVDSQGMSAQFAGFCPALAEQMEGTPVQFDAATRHRIGILRSLE